MLLNFKLKKHIPHLFFQRVQAAKWKKTTKTKDSDQVATMFVNNYATKKISIC